MPGSQPMSHGRDAYAEARARSQRALAPDQQKLSGGPGALAYVAAVRKLCRCGHAVLLHDINTKGIRSWCSYMDATGRCPCKKCELKNG